MCDRDVLASVFVLTEGGFYPFSPIIAPRGV